MLMKRKDVVQFTGMCYTTVYNLEKQGLFPSRKQLSPGRVAWLTSDIRAWLESRLNAESVFKALSVPFVMEVITSCTG